MPRKQSPPKNRIQKPRNQSPETPAYLNTHSDRRSVTFQPVGKVVSEIKEPKGGDWTRINSEIQLNARWLRGLKGIEEFSHIIVLFWFSRVHGVNQRVHPRKRLDLPLVGMFATRSPHRPNPIGMTVCRLIKRRGTRLWVRGLDAIDGTPVLDIKPYIPDNDSVKRPRVAGWVKKLRDG